MRSKQTTSKVPRNRYRGFEVRAKWHDWGFEGQRTAWKKNVTLLVVINKKIRCAWSTYNVNCNKIGMVDAFSFENARTP